MLGRAAERFIRTKWASPQELAEELYAIFSPDQPIEASQIIINQSADSVAPPFIINRQPGSPGPSFVINRDGGSNNFGDIDIHGSQYGPSNYGGSFNPGDINFGPGNTFGSFNPSNINFGPGDTYGSLDFKGSTFTFGDFGKDAGGGDVRPSSGGIDLGDITFEGQSATTKLLAVPDPRFNPFVLYGEILAKSTGQVYTVKSWAKPPTANPAIGNLRVRFPMVDASELIPTGTPTIVLCFPGADPSSVTSILDAIGFVSAFLPEGS